MVSHSKWKVYVLALVSFLVGTSEYIISGILDQIAQTLGVTVAAAGQLITVFSLTYAIGTPILMAVTAKLDRRKLLLYSLGLFVIANLLSFVLPGFGMFIVSRIVMALGAGIVVVTALSIAASIAAPGQQASSIATVTMGFTASLIVGIPIGREISQLFGWKAVFLGIAVSGIIALIVLALTIPRMKGDEPVPLGRQIGLLVRPDVALGLGITFFWLGGYSLAYTYISPYLLEVSQLNESLLSVALLVFGIASLVGSKAGGFLTDRRGVTFTLIGGMMLHIISLLLLAMAHSIISLFAFLILWSFAAWSSGPTQQYNLASLAPESSGVMLSLNQSTMQLSMAVGAGLGGIIIEQISLASVIWFAALGVAIAAVGVLILSRVGSSKSLAGSSK
ncbi:MFS transporter [Paenibacillus massiliensis]|uniref:MFS transporter n=1 Tax=Paenibacillus massiliensis TaxID=225917 RepID=UPI00040B5F45|nr:MFS transporter [Paenibacillus massiliensis]